MRFSIGDRVVLKGSGVKGTIEQCEMRKIYDLTRSFTIERYLVLADGNSFPEWYHSSQLLYDGLSDKKKEEIDKLLIDVHLKYRQFDVIRGILENQKKQKE